MSNNEKNISVLIVDDDEHICQLLELYLQREGLIASYCNNGEIAISKIKENGYDAVLLDIMMPGIDGYEVLAEIRKFSNVPVIMLSARGEPMDKISGLDKGADDYITKPFEPDEVIARLRAVLRRSKSTDEIKRVELFNLAVNITDYTVTLNGERVDMTPKETELLFMLANTPMHVFTRDDLLNAIWGQGYTGDPRTVDVHIKRVREKLGDNQHWRLTTVWGVGYKIEVF